eukprot:scaffold86732_cov78-Phaeocystis_antarctica.AAC.5
MGCGTCCTMVAVASVSMGGCAASARSAEAAASASTGPCTTTSRTAGPMCVYECVESSHIGFPPPFSSDKCTP